MQSLGKEHPRQKEEPKLSSQGEQIVFEEHFLQRERELISEQYQITNMVDPGYLSSCWPC